MRLDHLVVSARTLDEGAAHVAERLGQVPGPGGRHALMGTHNRLLGLGDIYLEVIAIDPAAPSPDRPRWFDLDRFDGAPRLTNWVAGSDDLDAALARCPSGAGVATALERGDLHWRMAIPVDGRLPCDDCFPALIQWQAAAHPLQQLPDRGLRLLRLTVRHPEAGALAAALAPQLNDPRIIIVPGPAAALQAEVMTAQGPRLL